MTKRYQSLAIVLYVAVLMATLFYLIAEQVNLPFIGDRSPSESIPLVSLSTGTIAIVILLLIFLERRLDQQTLPAFSAGAATQQLALRFVMAIAAIVVSRVPFTVYLLYPPLLFAFFAFGRRVAYGAGLVSTLFVFSYVITYSQRSFLNLHDIDNLFVFLLGMLLLFLLANALQQEQDTHFHLQQAHDDLAQSHAQLQQYAAQVATLAAADERNRLARDIHDSLGHYLTATSIQLEKAAVYRNRDNVKSAEALDHARHTIREALREVRGSISILREGQSFDFEPELHDLVKKMSHHHLAIDLQQTGTPGRTPSFVQMTLYRTIQEGLTNVHKHAKATRTAVTLSFTPDEAAVQISDNGCGFDPAQVAPDGHYGLQGIHERIALVGGSVTLTSAPGEGTTLHVTIPQNNEDSK